MRKKCAKVFEVSPRYNRKEHPDAKKIMAKIKLYLDARNVGNAGASSKEFPLKVAITHKSRTAYINLNISLTLAQWDAEAMKVVGHPRKRVLTQEIQAEYLKYRSALLELNRGGELDGMCANEIREALLGNDKPKEKKSNQENGFLRTYERFVAHKTGGTKQLYEGTLRRVTEYVGKKIAKLRFEQIDCEWLQSFNDFLAKTSPSANARAIHFRNIRAVFNYAIDNKITNEYPFRRFKIKGEPTRKRNFDVETLRTIFNTECLDPWMEKYRDLFKLSFMLIGINFVDLCGLQEVKNGRVEYIRAKTKKPYSIKVEPEADMLIRKYRGDKALLNYLDNYKGYRLFYNNTCEGLRAIRDRINECGEADFDTLTTYWARHSWATIAASLDIPRDTIAAALGHGGNTVTDIYIEFDKRKIDEANRRVLNYVLYDWEGGWRPEEAPRKRYV